MTGPGQSLQKAVSCFEDRRSGRGKSGRRAVRAPHPTLCTVPVDMRDDDATAYHRVVPELTEVYLEDSYVLALRASANSLEFDVDLVLTPKHPEYRAPRPDEQHCFRRARITIDDAKSVHWVNVNMRPGKDATGEVDFGSIDVWSVNDGLSHIEGNWGDVDVEGGRVQLVIHPEDGASRRASQAD
jgi:hypothetical protein